MPRRGENIYKRKDGRWEGRYIKEHDIMGKTKYGYVYAKTYSEVKTKLKQHMMTSSNKELFPNNKEAKTYNNWLDLWLATKKNEVKESTFVRYSNIVNNHLRNNLGQYPIEKIDTFVLEQFIKSKYGIDSNILRMDSTNFPFYGLKYDHWNDGGATPTFCGHSKNKRNDLLHKSVQALCNGNGIVMTSRSYPGNTSDIEMNRDTLSFIDTHLDTSKYTIIADCKACVSDIVGSIIDMGMSFVTKVPNSFSDLIRETIVKSALNGGMDESADYPGRFLYDTHAPVTVGKGVKKDLRLVTYCLPNSYNEAKSYIETTGLSVIEKKLRILGHKRFYCESDALKAFNDIMSDDDAVAYQTDVKFEVDKRIQRKSPDQPFWRVITSNTRLNPSKADECAKKRSVSVLLTDIPFAEKNFIDPKNGKNADGIVDLYLGQDRMEKCFKIVKSGTGVAHIFIHKPSRQDAVVCLSTIATMISNVIDFVLKREMGDDAITKHISDYMMTVIVRYDPISNEVWMMGDRDACLLCQKVMEILGVEPLNLIGQ